MADRIDAAVESHQPPAAHPVAYRALGQSRLVQLRDRHHATLPGRHTLATVPPTAADPAETGRLVTPQ
jgi:hypothetical protein